jgi:hypothetical protein
LNRLKPGLQAVTGFEVPIRNQKNLAANFEVQINFLSRFWTTFFKTIFAREP